MSPQHVLGRAVGLGVAGLCREAVPMRNTPKYNGERVGGTCGHTCAAAGSTAGSAAAGRGLLSDSLPPGRCGPPGTRGGEGAQSDAAALGGREGEVGGRGTAMPPR